jgi:hypothetical protein
MTITNLTTKLGVVAALVTPLLFASSPSLALADESIPVVVSIETAEDPDCLAAFERSEANPRDLCVSTTTLFESSPQTPTLRELQTAGVVGLNASKVTLAVALATVLSKSYSQNVNSITDSVTQYGRFYYNGTRAWVGTSYSGYRGTHFCKLDWSVGYSIQIVGCTESGGTAYRNLHMQWHYSAFVSGFPVQWEEMHTVTVNKNGVISQ